VLIGSSILTVFFVVGAVSAAVFAVYLYGEFSGCIFGSLKGERFWAALLNIGV